MAGLTARFNLNRFGGGVTGTITDDGQKYTSTDRDTIDRLLVQGEVHDHILHPSDNPLETAATAVLTVDAGTLEAGETFSYRFSVVDAQGVESIAAPKVSVDTPDLLPAPAMPVPYVNPTDSGTLPGGIYYYAVSALRDLEETPLSAAAAISTVSGEGTVRVTLPEYGLADSFRVWRMGFAEAGFTKLGITTATEFVDNGAVPADPCACDPGNTPPQTNEGVAVYGITVTLPMGVDLSTALSWRLYRTTTIGFFPTDSLVHAVVERENEFDSTSPMLRSWTDAGDILTPGSPADSDLNLRFQPYVFDSSSSLPDPTLYPLNYPLVVAGVLYAQVGGDWQAIGSGGGDTSSGSSGSPVYTSPDGVRHLIVVDNLGAVSTVETIQVGPPSIPLAV